ncbi:hypothetical protein IJU97_05070 [bacterium]|nr:hypothetical protein [bacterium]
MIFIENEGSELEDSEEIDDSIFEDFDEDEQPLISEIFETFYEECSDEHDFDEQQEQENLINEKHLKNK